MIRFSIEDDSLRRLVLAMGPKGRTRLNRVAAYGLLALCRGYLRREAQGRHATAHRLGAAPTGHLEKAARDMTATANAVEGAVNVVSPGFGRAFSPITLRPRRARALTIPIAGEAYGKRADDLRRKGWTLFRSPAKGVRDLLMGKGPTGGVKALYALWASVTLPQDRTLLPADQPMADAVRAAVAHHLITLQRNAR